MNTKRFRAAMLGLSALALASLGGARAAHAQSPADKSAAEALFDDAVKKLDAKDYAPACKAFEASQRLDPGIGTLLYLADCYEKLGRTASAWATFREAASTAKAAGQGEREAVATKRASALEASLPKLSINVAAAGDVAGLEIRRDGELLPKAVWSAPLPIDPGEHTIEASAPGKKKWSTKVTTKAGETGTTVSVPALEAAPEPAVPKVAPKPDAPVASALPPPVTWSTQRTVGLVIGGVGLVGLGVGTFFGLRAGSLNGDADAQCRPGEPTKCNAQGASLGADAKSAATVSTVTFIAGGAALAGGVVVFLMAPGAAKAKTGKSVHAGPGVVASAPGLLLGGQW